MLIVLGSLYCKQYGPRLDGSLTSSLIRVQAVCFHEENTEVHLNIAAHVKGDNNFRPKNSGGIIYIYIVFAIFVLLI